MKSRIGVILTALLSVVFFSVLPFLMFLAKTPVLNNPELISQAETTATVMQCIGAALAVSSIFVSIISVCLYVLDMGSKDYFAQEKTGGKPEGFFFLWHGWKFRAIPNTLFWLGLFFMLIYAAYLTGGYAYDMSPAMTDDVEKIQAALALGRTREFQIEKFWLSIIQAEAVLLLIALWKYISPKLPESQGNWVCD